MEDNRDFIYESEECIENSYDILYADDIAKDKAYQKKKELEELEKEKLKKVKNKKINIGLNILIGIVIVGIGISAVNILFPEKIQQMKEPIEAYFINKEIEKQAANGELIPASQMDSETDNITWDTENESLITPAEETLNETEAKRSTSFEINDNTIHNFNEDISIMSPDNAYVQSTSKDKVLMLNAEKIYDLTINCKYYEVQDNLGKYKLIIYTSLTNENHPESTNLNGIFTANIDNEIITSNRNNVTVPVGETSEIKISFDLTEEQFKLLRDEIDNITFIYRDSYNYREIFATYGGNYLLN